MAARPRLALPRHRFWIMRHGETEHNAAGITQGHSDIMLNETGRAQARAAAEQARLLPLSCILSSDLARARETAALIAAATGVALHPGCRDLRERAFGRLEGGPRNAARWTHDLADSEPFRSFVRRVAVALATAVTPDCLVVAHRGVLEVTVALFGLPRPPNLSDNAQVTEIRG